ncbi:unnamed protein product [Orchesella dallaii]|uniref:Gustatory receptor n=1 Tax=Orchesella dallaii TaxID=48710 RepID=A0ABP1S8E7_9HEXA
MAATFATPVFNLNYPVALGLAWAYMNYFIISDMSIVQTDTSYRYVHNCLHNGKVYPTAQETLVYREIQVLAILNNIINQSAIFVLTAGVIVLLALCLTATIRLEWHMENIFAVAFFGIMSIDCFLFLLVCVGGMVSPYVESRKALETLKRQRPKNEFVRRGSRYCYRWLQTYVHNCLHNGKVYPTAQETLVYREIQVLAILNNIINQSAIFVLTAGVIVLLALCLTATIRLEWHMENIFAVAFFGIMSIDCFLFLLVCVGGMVSPYVESRKALETLKRQRPKNEFVRRGSRYCYRWLQTYVKSCFLIKVKMGKDNFLEELTPLNCVNLAINVTVNILLLTVSHKKP